VLLSPIRARIPTVAPLVAQEFPTTRHYFFMRNVESTETRNSMSPAFKKGREKDGLVQTPSIGIRFGGLNYDQFIEGVRNRKLMYRDWFAPYPELWETMVERLISQPVIPSRAVV
jgi:hypothetical protein